MKTAATFLILFSSLHLAQAQTPTEQQKRAVFDSFHTALNELTGRFGNKPVFDRVQTGIVQSLARIAGHVQIVEFVIIESRKQVPREYFESVGLDAELLKRLARLESTSEAERERLHDGLKEVEADLELKATPIRNSGDVARLVQVLVHAKKGNQAVGAYEVWYVPKGWVGDSSHVKRFDRLTNPSSPSSMNLAPGNYFFWLSKGKPVTDHQPVSIGMPGEKVKEIDVVVP